jgi:hypothetical protein
MRTVTDATLYIVKGPKGSYCAIRENDTGMVITERTEHAAAVLASSKDMIIVDRREISHDQLLAMMASNCGDPQSAFDCDQLQMTAGDHGASQIHSSGLPGFARKSPGGDSQSHQ